jgi:hypothetical protein
MWYSPVADRINIGGAAWQQNTLYLIHILPDKRGVAD